MATLFSGDARTCIESNERGEPVAMVDEANVDTSSHVESFGQCFQSIRSLRRLAFANGDQSI